MRESTTIAKNPQTRLPSVNSVGRMATARIGFIALLPSGHDMAAGFDHATALDHDFHGIRRQNKLGAGAKFDHTKFFASRDGLPGIERADDAAGEHPRDLLHRESPGGRIGTLEADPH